MSMRVRGSGGGGFGRFLPGLVGGVSGVVDLAKPHSARRGKPGSRRTRG